MRTVAAVIVGYMVMFVLVMATFTGAYLAMGTDRAFCPGTYDASRLWIAVSLVLGAVAAVGGGMACAAIATNPKAAPALAGLVAVMGLLVLVGEATQERPTSLPARTGDVGNMEAMQKAVTPMWTAVVNPLVGVAGVLIGGRLRRRRDAGAAST
jgi:hypothetical protein